MRSETMTHRLADFARGLHLPNVPTEVRTQGKLSILDTLGCIFAGSQTPEASMLLTAERDGGGPCRVIGTSVSLRAQDAARCNGYFGDIFELNDLTGGHAGIANVTAMLANAEELNASGDALLVATIVGIEVTTRIYNSLYSTLKPYSECGMGMIGLANTVGVAAGSARLRNLNAEQTRAALDIAGGLAGWCPAEAIFGAGSSMKPLLFGAWPASVGLLAARYAGAGMSGPPSILDGEMGFSKTVSRELDAGAIEVDTWALSRPRRKVHACCGYIHSALDTVSRQAPAELENARAIRVRVAPYVMRVMGRSTPPRTSNEARFHAQYCVALAASGCPTILPAHSEALERYLADPKLQQAYGRVTLDADDTLTHYHQTTIEIEGADGSVLRDANASPKGSPDNPMTDQEVAGKFHALADPVVGERRADEIQALIDGLSGAKPLDGLWAALGPPSSKARSSGAN